MLSKLVDPDAAHDDMVNERDWINSEVRFSHLRAYGRSPMHGQHARQQDMKQTRDMQRGSAVHHLIFGTKKVVGYTGSVRRGKEYDAFAEKHPGAEILTMAEYDKAMFMAEAVIDNPLAKPLLKGVTEETIRFDWMGLRCRATPDVRGQGFLTELKTAKSADPQKFLWSALRLQYPAQMRMQQIAAGQKLGEGICYIVCVESETPHPVTVFRIDDKALLLGERNLILWAERLKGCESSNAFPGYAQDIVPLIAPEDDVLEYGDDE